MPDEQLTSVLKNSTSAVVRITVHYLHFASIRMEIEILRQYLNNSVVNL